MTAAEFAARCTAAGLTVLGVEDVGRQVCCEVAPFSVTPETVIKRLGLNVTLGFGDGSGGVTLWFEAREKL